MGVLISHQSNIQISPYRRISFWNWNDVENLPDKKECGECKDKVKKPGKINGRRSLISK
jgi:hypothetical protein